ncbi:uncharacterized protein [Elaeis guineensis]|uniref:uncharacterized protein isoform X3 n=1 Tax=Elaeis guineensis var. tenera TaxID=51953 RepID=UPI003C6D9BCC
MVNWELKHCCDHDQVVFIVTIGVFTVIILALWRTVLLTPFKLVTVFLHETSHALACKLTCGQVEGMEVHANEGGVTRTRGGIYWLILPAGLDTSRTVHRLHHIPCDHLAFTRNYEGPRSSLYHFVHSWEKITCAALQTAGVMNSLFSVYDIYDDLISRRVHSSDAEKFAEIFPCPCNGVAWGVIWGLISFVFLCGSIYLGLVILS